MPQPLTSITAIQTALSNVITNTALSKDLTLARQVAALAHILSAYVALQAQEHHDADQTILDLVRLTQAQGQQLADLTPGAP